MPRTIGQVVKKLRAERGLSQYDIARSTNGEVKQSWINSLEHGDIKNPPQEKLEALAAVLGTTVTDIYSRAGIIDIPTEGTSPLEKRLLADFRSLSQDDQQRALVIVHTLMSADQVTEEPAQDAPAQKANPAA